MDFLDEFNENAALALLVQKSDPMAPGTGASLLINQFCTGGLLFVELSADARHGKGQVVLSGAFFVYKSRYW